MWGNELSIYLKLDRSHQTLAVEAGLTITKVLAFVVEP